MFPDFIKDTIKNSWCRDCTFTTKYYWSNGQWCCGQIKSNKSNPACDVIRFCDKDPQYFMQEYSPDEALILSSMLTKVTSNWLWDNEKYRKFKIGSYENV